MSDITASERRLRAALDRMDKMLDVPPRPAEAAAPAPSSAADYGALAELHASDTDQREHTAQTISRLFLRHSSRTPGSSGGR